MDSVEITIAPVPDPDGKHRIMIGFSNEHFSQCVNLPYTNMDDVRKVSDEFRKAIFEAGEKCDEWQRTVIRQALTNGVVGSN